MKKILFRVYKPSMSIYRNEPGFEQIKYTSILTSTKYLYWKNFNSVSSTFSHWENSLKITKVDLAPFHLNAMFAFTNLHSLQFHCLIVQVGMNLVIRENNDQEMKESYNIDESFIDFRIYLLLPKNIKKDKIYIFQTQNLICKL